MSTLSKKKVVVVTNDAGGAEVVSAWVRANRKKYTFFCIVSGPAEKIFKRKGIKPNLIVNTKFKSKFDITAILKKNNPVNFILTGTSWGSFIELDAIRVGKECGVKTISYLDHWVNYRERFGFPRKAWNNYLPDQIWVGDTYAAQLAHSVFAKEVVKIKVVRNLFFKEIKTAYNKLKSKSSYRQSGILFASEPLSSSRNAFGDKNVGRLTENEILRKLLQWLTEQCYRGLVIIRLHPAESADKYNALIKEYTQKLQIEKTIGHSIARDMVRIQTVIGMSSMFLVTASLCGKQAISFLPSSMGRSPLPSNFVISIKTLKQLKRLLVWGV